MGRFLSVDPMGYKDSMNLFQAFHMNPINFLDPLGLWKREGDWEIGRCLVKRQKRDTLEELSVLITGNPAFAQLLGNQRGSKYVDVTPLVLVFKKQVQKNIVRVAKNAPNTLNATFTIDTYKHSLISEFDEEGFNSLFSAKKDRKEVYFDCSKAAWAIQIKGLINTLKQGEFDALGINPWLLPRKFIGIQENIDDIEKRDSISEDVEEGDITHFYNKKDYVERFSHAGMEGEWVVKVGPDSFYGFGNPGSIKSYLDWQRSLLNNYNYLDKIAGGKNPATLSDVVGYYGHIVRFDFIKIAQLLFDLRNN
jgi:hypothetical protein